MEKLTKYFKLSERGTTVRTEVIAGLTTFMAMAYILMVNPGMFAELPDASFGAVYIATALSAVIGTVLIGLLANLPLAQASGMGLNAFFVYTVCFGLGFTYANALVFVLIDGLVFVALTVTGLRRVIFEAIPAAVKKAIPAGIGLFIAFIGMQNIHLVVDDGATLVNMHSFNVLSDSFDWASVMPILVSLICVFAIAIMFKKGVKGAILWGILGGAVLYYAVAFATVDGAFDAFVANWSFNPFTAFKEFGTDAVGQVFINGFDFSHYLADPNHSVGGLILALITSALAFCIVDMFDTLGTLYGACRGGDLLVENAETGEQDIPNLDQAMLADAIATTAGAICGTSTVTTYVESSAGVGAGGRTGLSSMVTAAMFFVAMFLSPIAAIIPTCAYSAALIYVGILMIGCVKDIDWANPVVSLPAFLTMAIMPLTYNISYGIAFGIISYVVLKSFSGKIKEIRLSSWIITALFIAMFVLTH